MKKRDYSNPHIWQQSAEERHMPKPKRISLKPYIMIIAAAIVVIAYVTMHQHRQRHLAQKQTGPIIKTVTLPIHQQASPTHKT